MATQTYGPDALFQARSADPRYEYYEADQVAPAGQWRTRVNGDAWTLERAATAEFATVTTPISVASTGAISYSSTGAWTFTRTNDAASVQVLIIEGDRATPGDNDEAYISLRLSDSAGNQDEQARISWIATTVQSGATQDGDLVLSALVNNTLTELFRLDGSIPAVVVNEGQADVDFRIESNGNENAIVLDANLFGGIGQLSIGSAAQATATAFVVVDPPAITATSNQNFYRLFVDNSAAVTITAATTSAVVSTLALDEPNVTATGTVTSTALLYLTGLATEGTSNAQIVLQGSTSSTTVVQADRVQLLALDFAAGDARLAVFGETGGVAYLGGGSLVIGGGDATVDMGLYLDSSGTDWYVAIDNSDNDKLEIGSGSAVGTARYMTFDPRNTAGVDQTTINAPAVTIGSGAGNNFRFFTVAGPTLNYTGATTVTALVPFVRIGQLTIAGDTATLTVNKATALEVIPPVESTNIALGVSSAIRVLDIAGGTAPTTQAGIYIEDLTTGTSDYGIYIEGADTAAIYVASADPIHLGVAGTSTGKMEFDGATSGTVTLTVAAVAGTWTFTLPPDDGDAGEQLQTNGGGITTWEAAASRRALKDVLGELQPRDALDRILGTQAYLFRYTTAQHTTGDLETIYAGVMAEEAPWVMHHDGRIFSPVSAFGYASMAIRALHEDIETIEERVARLESENASLRERIAALEAV